MLKYTFITIFLLIGVTPLIAQDVDVTKVTAEDVEWSEGTIYLSTGEKLNGLLKLNTKTGILAFESGSTSRSFTPRNVSAFEYVDVIQRKKRKFISVDYEAHKASGNGLGKDRRTPSSKIPQFFEILVEFPAFALLSSIGQMQIKTSTTNPGYQDPTTNTWTNTGLAIHNTTYSQTERLFIFDADGNINLLLDITEKETDGLLFDTKKKSIKNHDDELLEQYTAPHFEKLKAFAKENKLSFKRKDDILKVLEYYKQLLSP